MPSEAPVLPTQTEKPNHYSYLKEFRTHQCALFLQHKCTQHRPYTCFHWHFMNQRRRRPIRKRDGTFNYSPDLYCTKYDETTGICPDGDDCPYLHRTAGDTERRYHLRYYKTGTCVHETDAKGHCVKNGPHCAFAHGAADLRPPVYDVRELQSLDGGVGIDGLSKSPGSSLGESPVAATQLEKDRITNEDPKWNDTNYVLANYKTEQCKRPPRLCRQGYACPSYHNPRDRRRSPKKFKYRSTPCPNVKHGDDWGDPAQCDNGDGCSYCHTRTEQQFHPEIYKSTKCNDMVQTGYCPRGPFCAFAHVEQEMTSHRNVGGAADTSLAAFVTNALPPSSSGDASTVTETSMAETKMRERANSANEPAKYSSVFKSNDSNHASVANHVEGNGISSSLPEPIGKGRSGSSSSPFFDTVNHMKAPGHERDDANSKLHQQIQAIESDTSIDQAEKNKRKQNLVLLHTLNSHTMGGPLVTMITSITSTPTTPSSTMSSTMSPHAPSFYPAGDTVESVVGNALDEDLNLGELNLQNIDIAKDNDDSNSVCSSLSAGFPSTSSYLGATSVPVTIPSGGGIQRGSLGSLSQSPSSSPIGSGSLPPPFVPQDIQLQQKQEQKIEQAAAAFWSQPNPGRFAAPGFTELNSMSPRSSISQSPLLGGAFCNSAGASSSTNGYGELQRLREELTVNKSKMSQWEEGIQQARNACEAWKHEAEECRRKKNIAEEERIQAFKQRDEAFSQLAKQKQDIELTRATGVSFINSIQRVKEVESMPLNNLIQLQAQLQREMELVQNILFRKAATMSSMKCMLCSEIKRVAMVCPHAALCDSCATKRKDCAYCLQKPSLVLPPL